MTQLSPGNLLGEFAAVIVIVAVAAAPAQAQRATLDVGPHPDAAGRPDPRGPNQPPAPTGPALEPVPVAPAPLVDTRFRDEILTRLAVIETKLGLPVGGPPAEEVAGDESAIAALKAIWTVRKLRQALHDLRNELAEDRAADHPPPRVPSNAAAAPPSRANVPAAPRPERAASPPLTRDDLQAALKQTEENLQNKLPDRLLKALENPDFKAKLKAALE